MFYAENYNSCSRRQETFDIFRDRAGTLGLSGNFVVRINVMHGKQEDNIIEKLNIHNHCMICGNTKLPTVETHTELDGYHYVQVKWQCMTDEIQKIQIVCVKQVSH